MKIVILLLFLVPTMVLAQPQRPLALALSPPFDGTRNSILIFNYASKRCERYSDLTRDIVVTRTGAGFELRFDVLISLPDCFGTAVEEASIQVALPFLVPDSSLPTGSTISVRLGDGQHGQMQLRPLAAARQRAIPIARQLDWLIYTGPQFRTRFLRGFPGADVGSNYQVYSDVASHPTGYCQPSSEECFAIFGCQRSGDVELGVSQFGIRLPSCNSGTKRHFIYVESPSLLTIWNEDGTTIAAADSREIDGRWQIVDPNARLKYGLTGIEITERGQSGVDFGFSGSAGRGTIVCDVACNLNLHAPARGNSAVRIEFTPNGITRDRIYRFVPFPDASPSDLARGLFSGLGTWTLVMMRE